MQRSVVWRRQDRATMEFFTLSQVTDGWRLSGTVVAVDAGRPLLISYAVACDADWRTQLVDLSVNDGDDYRWMSLRSTESGVWLANELPVPGVDGCVDIDLGVTPATNTLPIRRLNLAVGEGADAIATWVVFPSLEIRPLSQRYTRIGEHRYRYESNTGFSTELDVDEHCIVMSYPGGWNVIAGI